jgi:DNA polymerase-3 subunit epsilon
VVTSFIAVDFETANPKRVSACSIGYARVSNGEIAESKGYLIKPVGGHAPFQTKIHGIKEEDTSDKPDFKELLSEIEDIFNYPLVGHSLFDKQVLNSLSDHFDLNLNFDYSDSSAIAKAKLPDLKNHKLKTLVKHFDLPKFKHHDALEDAISCAKIYLKLQCLESNNKEEAPSVSSGQIVEFAGLISGILADDEVNYKETYQLLYWLEDHPGIASQYNHLFIKTKEVLEDNILDRSEAEEMKILLTNIKNEIYK